MGLNIDGSDQHVVLIRTNKPVSQNKKTNLERQTEKALNDYNSIREKIDNGVKGGMVKELMTSSMSLKSKKFVIA